MIKGGYKALRMRHQKNLEKVHMTKNWKETIQKPTNKLEKATYYMIINIRCFSKKDCMEIEKKKPEISGNCGEGRMMDGRTQEIFRAVKLSCVM